MIRASHEPQTARAHGSAWGELKEGARFVLAHPVARMMLVLGLVPPLLLIPSFSALMPVFAAFISLGSLISGAGADALGPQLTVVVTALGAIAVATWARSRALREVRLSGLVSHSA